MSAQVPYDLFIVFALFGGQKLALNFASTSQAVKRHFDQRYSVPCLVSVSNFLDPRNKYTRRPGAVGKYTRVRVTSGEEMKYIPSSAFYLVIFSPVTQEDVDSLHIGITDILYLGGRFSGCRVPLLFPGSVLRLDSNGSILRLPPNLESLIFLRDINFTLPPTLKHLQCHISSQSQWDTLHIPSTLEKLKVHISSRVSLHGLPSRLKELFIFGNINIDGLKLPPNLEILEFKCFLDDIRAISFPSSLRKLYLENFDGNVDGFRIPACEVDFGYQFNSPVDKLIVPEGVTSLTFGERFCQNMDKLKLPKGFLHLKIQGDLFNGPLPELPESLISLNLPLYFSRSIDNLPLCLEELEIGSKCWSKFPREWAKTSHGEYLVPFVDKIKYPNLRRITVFDVSNRSSSREKTVLWKRK